MKILGGTTTVNLGIVKLDVDLAEIDVVVKEGDEIVGAHLKTTDVGVCLHRTTEGLKVGVGLGVIAVHVTLTI
jgi:hypothetical protein